MSTPAPAAAIPESCPAHAPKEPVKVKPCCVCTDEKSLRDECLLFNGQESGKCNELIEKYKVCMKGYGFNV
ncbi:similar to Saccharomyces cerevisiae YLL009C COX17 Copper metallochaperone that transfers copper to Sco1p and Cox11p for eventual delivery to cytochrome c oxidase [Geotrichum candidum]|uniref:Similar to Saccharomyces cerevisiae YLL009C COX17 Copper metallochaperone that transfers copper to Sco1p and Cox11p for eventual delivery to cytochrome c oxidase n=1 Tax=Geotrichum candidum TaxID=1173061 RepID=A0A0J9XBZ2_GEOCN|nr:similar to Saccharomyces cerevisiae YLL009C COX17 Copper metallochaperone that transfers copper to Sco1p and Cox11p for eventual delivery to cytochrome c oxidase [Geotrichum candidum]